MREVLVALDRLVDDGVVSGYAIGGAVGAAFYIEAAQTEDVDAFVFLPVSASGLVSLAPVYAKLQSMGGMIDGEHVRFGAWPLQILPDSNLLITEAIRDAVSIDFEGVITRVFRAEHLCAIALQTGRSKDFLRVRMFLEQDAVDRERLSRLVEKHGLQAAMQKLMRDADE